MPNYNINVKFSQTIKADNGKDAIAKAKAGAVWTADKIIQPPPTPPPSNNDFLPLPTNTTRILYDDCKSDPIHIYGCAVAQRKDGNEQATFNLDELVPGRIQQLSDTKGNFRRFTPHSGDHTWSAPRACFGFPDDSMPCALYHEGYYYRTTFYLRIDPSFVSTGGFHQIMEQKHCYPFPSQPAYWNSLEIRGGKWFVDLDWREPSPWATTFNEPLGELIPITVEGVYSVNSSKGWLRYKCGKSVSPTIKTNTLSGSSPKFLQLGVYRDNNYPPTWVDYFNIEVYRGPAIPAP